MTAPRLEIDLSKVHHNARRLVQLLGARGVEVLGVTKAVLGSAEVARVLVDAGVVGLGDSRIENIEAMRRDGVQVSLALIRSPMLSQAERVVQAADLSFNTELKVLRALSRAAEARHVVHGVVLMIELGDLREGVMPDDVIETVRQILSLANIKLRGIGANLACRSGVMPDDRNMAALSAQAESIERTFGISLDIVSGGNSANIQWALGTSQLGRINHLRLGESILLGRETVARQPIAGLFTDAVTLIAEVIETKTKPSMPWGQRGEPAFEETIAPVDRGLADQSILALGHQDTDPTGLQPPSGVTIVGASSDHLIVGSSERRLSVGDELGFSPNYSAMVRSMTSPFVHKEMKGRLARESKPALLQAAALKASPAAKRASGISPLPTGG